MIQIALVAIFIVFAYGLNANVFAYGYGVNQSISPADLLIDPSDCPTGETTDLLLRSWCPREEFENGENDTDDEYDPYPEP